MKKKLFAVLLGVSLAMCGTCGVMVSAEEAPAENTETAQDASAQDGEKAPDTGVDAVQTGPDVTLNIGAASLTIKNGTPENFKKAEYVPGVESASLILTDAAGKKTVFENAEPEKWTEPKIISRFGFFYIEYKGEAEELLLAAPKGEEKVFTEPVSAYPIEEVNVRAEAKEDAEILKTALPGEEWKAVASLPGWVKIERDGVSGYAVCGYLTESKDAAEKAAGTAISPAGASVTPAPSAAPTPTPAAAVQTTTTTSGSQSSSSHQGSTNNYDYDDSDDDYWYDPDDDYDYGGYDDGGYDDDGDTGGDTGGNTGGDTGGNTGGDTGGDTGEDTGGNTGGDTGGDTGGNTGGDTGADTGGDTGGDTGADAGE